MLVMTHRIQRRPIWLDRYLPYLILQFLLIGRLIGRLIGGVDRICQKELVELKSVSP